MTLTASPTTTAFAFLLALGAGCELTASSLTAASASDSGEGDDTSGVEATSKSDDDTSTSGTYSDTDTSGRSDTGFFPETGAFPGTDTGNPNPDTGFFPDTGFPIDTGGDTDTGENCVENVFPVPLAQVTAAGFSGQELVDRYVREYDTELRWPRPLASDRLSTSIAGTTDDLIVSLATVGTEAELVIVEGGCNQTFMRVPLQMEFQSGDGRFNETVAVVGEAESVFSMRVERAIEASALTGTFAASDVTTRNPGEVVLDINFVTLRAEFSEASGTIGIVEVDASIGVDDIGTAESVALAEWPTMSGR